MIGTTVGKYRILERLGRGGMGIVYKALDETLDREVAIKVLNPDVDDEELLKRFRGEAISLARLNHPGIATIYELHRHGDEMLMVMEYVRGETLQGLSERMGPLEPPQAAHICVQVLNALAHAHRAGIVHRDLKPANVMITDAGVVKVMDFGIARMLGGEHVTHAGFMMGTPAYMAPEQVLGQDVDGRADLYSVGVLFYRLLTRELPFQADTAIAMAQKQVAEAPTPLGTFRPNLPTWCEAIISRALAKSREERFQTAEAFRAAILMAVAPVPLGDLPTMTLTTPTSSGLLRTSDLNLSGSVATSDAPTVLSGTGEVRAAASSQAAAAAATPVSSPIERTGTTVVLGRSHLITLAAMLLLLVGGIGALGYMLLRRADSVPASDASGETTAAPSPAAEPQAAPPDTTAAAAADAGQPPAPSDPGRTDAPPPSTPPAAPAAANPSAASSAIGRGDVAAKKPKPLPKEATGTVPPVTPPATAPPTAEPPAAPAVPVAEVAPVTFNAVKMLVQQGNAYRDRDAVLRLEGDRLSVLEKDGKSELLSLPYSVILQAFYSRSKQPKWKGPDGKERTVDVDLGKMSFFRGERNWLILTTQGVPLFIRFEDRDLSAALSAVRQRTGIAIQR